MVVVWWCSGGGVTVVWRWCGVAVVWRCGYPGSFAGRVDRHSPGPWTTVARPGNSRPWIQVSIRTDTARVGTHCSEPYSSHHSASASLDAMEGQAWIRSCFGANGSLQFLLRKTWLYPFLVLEGVSGFLPSLFGSMIGFFLTGTAKTPSNTGTTPCLDPKADTAKKHCLRVQKPAHTQPHTHIPRMVQSRRKMIEQATPAESTLKARKEK